MQSVEEKLARLEVDLALSYECLALEQETCKQAERETRVAAASQKAALERLRHSEERWQAALMRCRELEFEVSLVTLDLQHSLQRADELEDQLYLSEERRLEDREELTRLGRRLQAAQERVRELETMLCERSPDHPVCLDQTLANLLGNKQLCSGSVTTSPSRTQVDGWMASWS